MRLKLRESLLLGLMRLLKSFDRRDTSAPAFDPDRVRSILIISSTALGDTVMSTAAITVIRQRYPAAHIVALIHRNYAELFRRVRGIDEVVPYHGGWRRFLRTALHLNHCRCDLALILHGNEPQATPLAWLAGARFIFKLPNTSSFRFLLSNQVPVLGWPDLGHGVAQRLRVATMAGADIADARIALPVFRNDEDEIRRWLARQGIHVDTPLVGFQLGASSRGRMWPVDHYVALAARLSAQFPDVRFVLTGSADEEQLCESTAARIGRTALSAAGMLPLNLLPALLRRLSVLVTGDTGTLHVAVAVGTPTVSLFAVSDPARSGPAQDMPLHTVIHHPCPELVQRSKTDDDTCIARISVDEVAAAVSARLGKM